MLKMNIMIMIVIMLLGVSRATINTEDLTENLPDTSKLTTIPKNEDIFEQINSVKGSLEDLKQNSELDEKTKKLITTVEKIIESAKTFIQEKNSDEGLQKFAKHAANISSLIAEEAKGKTGKIYEDLQQFSSLIPKINRLVVNVVSSWEFRKILWSTLHSFSDIFSKVSAESSSNLRRVEKSAENLKEDVKKTAREGYEGVEQVKDDVKDDVRSSTEGGKNSVDELKNAAKKTVEKEGEQGSVDELKGAAKESAKKATHATQEVAGKVKDSAQRAYNDKAGNLKEGVEDIKESAQDLKEDVKKTAKQAYQTTKQEGKRLFLERIQPLLKKITTHQEYQEAVSEIQDLFDYFRNLKDDEVTSISPKLQQELNSLCDEATELVGRFTNGRNIKKIKDSFWKLYNELYIDQETSKYFSDLSKLARDIVKNPKKYQDSSKYLYVFSDIYDRGTSLVQDKYGQQFSELSSELGDVYEDLSNQKLSLNVRQGVQLASQILLTSSPIHVLSQLRQLATPYLRNFTKQIKLPSIEGEAEDTQYKIENIIFQVEESKLEDILLKFTVGLKDKIIVELKLSDLDLTFRDVHFQYKNKYLQDAGIMDVQAKFPSWFLRWGFEDGDSLFGNTTVEVQLDALDITIQQANHKLVDKVALGLFSSWVKEKVRLAIETAMREPANTLTQQFNDFVSRNKEFLQNQIIYSDQPSDSYLPQHFQSAA